MKQLGIELDRPASYYLSDTSDGGARAQEFGERVYGRIESTIDKNTANYFGFARNILLDIAQKTSASQIKGQLEASRVELPGQFSEIPETNQLAWANQVYGYFAAKMYSVEDTPVSGKGSKD
jgi:hypothetical protein